MELLKDKPRIAGVIALLVGSGGAYWFYQYTMEEAMKHEAETIYMPHGFALLVAFALLGVALILFGEKLRDYSKGLKDRKKTLKDWLLIGCFVVPGIAAFLFLQYQLNQIGYE